MNVHLTPDEVFMALGAVVVLLAAWRVSVRVARRAAERASAGARLVSLVGRVGFTAGVIAGTQWLVVTHAAGNSTLVWAVLGGPALLSGFTLTRALTITTTDLPRHRGRRGGRR
jgi:hypothetical protein